MGQSGHQGVALQALPLAQFQEIIKQVLGRAQARGGGHRRGDHQQGLFGGDELPHYGQAPGGYLRRGSSSW